MPELGSWLPPRRRVVPGLAMAVGGPAVVAGALFPFRDGFGNATAGMSFVVPVVLATALGGAPASVVAVVLGFLAYNVLFTAPYYTLAVAHPPDIAGLVVYVLVGAVTAVIVSLRQQEATVARQRELEAVAMFELSRSLISELRLEVVFEAVVERVHRLFEVRSATVLVGDESSEQLRVATHVGAPLPEGVLPRLMSGQIRGLAAPGFEGQDDIELFPLLAGEGMRGVLVVHGDIAPSSQRVLTAFANQAALALHRAELIRAATRVQVLEESDRVRSALIRSVSHDLRTPLSSITAAAEDLCDPQVRLEAQDRRLLAATIAEEARRLDRLVANLLDMGRLEAGRLEVRPEAVDVVELVRAACANEPTADVRVELPLDLPPVEVDPLLIEQVFRNLLENARRFSPAPGSIRIGGRQRDDRVEVAVEDRGPGITETDRERIFEVFNGARSEGSPGGTGLGLAICRGYVRAHGGEVWAEGSPAGGARFVVSLPVASDVPDELAPPYPVVAT